jgi:two-component system, OmpR family, response regulator
MTAGMLGKIVLASADSAIVENLWRRLEDAGYAIATAASCADARLMLANDPLDLLLMDAALPGGDPVAVASEAHLSRGVPVVLLNTPDSAVHCASYLETFADDCMLRTAEPREMAARVKGALRRRAMSRQGRAGGGTAPGRHPVANGLAIGNLAIDPVGMLARTACGRDIDLTTTEFKLLLTFARSAHRVLSRDYLTDQVKGHGWAPDDRSIDVLVSKLRRKLMLAGVKTPIKAVRGAGYVLSDGA